MTNKEKKMTADKPDAQPTPKYVIDVHDHGNCELCDRIEAELAAAQHDVTRHVQIATDLANELAAANASAWEWQQAASTNLAEFWVTRERLILLRDEIATLRSLPESAPQVETPNVSGDGKQNLPLAPADTQSTGDELLSIANDAVREWLTPDYGCNDIEHAVATSLLQLQRLYQNEHRAREEAEHERDALRLALLQERERCAKVCDDITAQAPYQSVEAHTVAYACATAIRTLPDPDLTEAKGEPVAYVIQAHSDGSFGTTIAPVKYLMFDGLMEKLKNDPWIKAGRASVVPLYASPQPVAGKDVERQATLYLELLYAVGNKYPGESRHATALRYIRQTEQSGNGMKDSARGAGKECK